MSNPTGFPAESPVVLIRAERMEEKEYRKDSMVSLDNAQQRNCVMKKKGMPFPLKIKTNY